MTVTTLFGINLIPLCIAIAEVESNGGTTSPNTYQLTSEYLDRATKQNKTRKATNENQRHDT